MNYLRFLLKGIIILSLSGFSIGVVFSSLSNAGDAFGALGGAIIDEAKDKIEEKIDTPDNAPSGDLVVEVPRMNGQAPDVNIDDDIIRSRGDDLSFTNLIKQANVYLWILAIMILMILIIYAGFLLITGRGQPEKLKKANDILMYIGIGFGIILLAYAIVRLVVNLF